jgi:hypothetical protein
LDKEIAVGLAAFSQQVLDLTSSSPHAWRRTETKILATRQLHHMIHWSGPMFPPLWCTWHAGTTGYGYQHSSITFAYIMMMDRNIAWIFFFKEKTSRGSHHAGTPGSPAKILRAGSPRLVARPFAGKAPRKFTGCADPSA